MDTFQTVALSLLTSSVLAAVIAGAFAWSRDRDVERLKAELDRRSFEHETKYLRVYEKRAEVIAELYRLIVASQRALAAAIPSEYEIAEARKAGPVEETKLTIKAIGVDDAFVEVLNYFNFHRLYLTDEQIRIMRNLTEQLEQASIWTLESTVRIHDERWTSVHQEAASQAQDEITKLQRSLETSFREILGFSPITGNTQS